MMMMRRILRGVGLLAVSGSAAWGQRWRTLDTSRQLRDSSAAEVRVQYGAGKLELRPLATSGDLYTMSLRYDAEHSEPLARWDATTRRLEVGLRGSHGTWNGSSDDKGSMHLDLSPALPLRVALEVGAIEGDLQFGGLRLSELTLKAGAADVVARWDQPNRERLGRLTVDAGAASVRLVRAGNAHADRIALNMGIGGLELDLGGEWTREIVIDARVAMGKFTLRLPEDVGLEVNSSSFLMDFEKAGLRKRGNAWYSTDYDAAPRRVRLELSGAFGKLAILRDTK